MTPATKPGRGLAALAAALVVVVSPAVAQMPAPRILLDQPLVAVEYQLNRLSADDLARLERRDDDVRYRPVYYALLTRQGLAPDVRDEALAALVKLESAGAARVLAQALAKVPAADPAAAGRLLARLFAEPAASFAAERGWLAGLIDAPGSPHALAAAYGGLVLADAAPDAAWAMAARRGHAAAVVQAMRYLPWTAGARPMQAAVFAAVADLVEDADDVLVRRAAVGALAAIRADAAAFRILAGEVVAGADDGVRAEAVGAILRIPPDVWPADAVLPLAGRVLAVVRDTPEARRSDPPALEAIELGEKLAARLPDDAGRALVRELRALGVRVIRIAAVPEELRFDTKWFVVEAGRPIQIVLSNPDAMPHNLVVVRPGALEEIGNVGSGMSMPTDPNVKPFVPASPLVLQATGLVGFEGTARLSFTAPGAPGEYPFVCTFPGHWTRMYGVMLVVSDLEAWEARRLAPTDPITQKPME